MTKYYGSRAFIAAVLTALLAGFGLVWWGAVIIGLLAFGAFVLLARSGRYVVQSEGAVNPMRRDEMAQEINRRAGLNGFVALVLGVGGLTFCYGAVIHNSVPVSLLALALVLSLVIYFVTDYRLRKL